MKHFILAMSVFIIGCSGGDSADAAKEEAATVGQDVAETLNDAQQAAKDVEATLEEKKQALDEELDKAND